MRRRRLPSLTTKTTLSGRTLEETCWPTFFSKIYHRTESFSRVDVYEKDGDGHFEHSATTVVTSYPPPSASLDELMKNITIKELKLASCLPYCSVHVTRINWSRFNFVMVLAGFSFTFHRWKTTLSGRTLEETCWPTFFSKIYLVRKRSLESTYTKKTATTI